MSSFPGSAGDIYQIFKMMKNREIYDTYQQKNVIGDIYKCYVFPKNNMLDENMTSNSPHRIGY
jgi:hypothetical protein